MASLFKIATVNPDFIAQTPNPGFVDKNIAANSYYERQDKDRQFQEQHDQRQSEREIKAMEAMLKNPQQAQAIAQSYGVQITPQIEEMLQHPKEAQQLNEAIKLAKDSGLDRYQSIQEFVTGYMQSGGDPMQAMESVTDKASLKETYYNTIANRPGRGSGTNPYGNGRVLQPNGDVIDYTAGIKYKPDGTGEYIKTPDGQPVKPPKTSSDAWMTNGTTPTTAQPTTSPSQEFINEYQRRSQTTSPQLRPAPTPLPQRAVNPSDPFNTSNYPILDDYND